MTPGLVFAEYSAILSAESIARHANRLAALRSARAGCRHRGRSGSCRDRPQVRFDRFVPRPRAAAAAAGAGSGRCRTGGRATAEAAAGRGGGGGFLVRAQLVLVRWAVDRHAAPRQDADPADPPNRCISRNAGRDRPQRARARVTDGIRHGIRILAVLRVDRCKCRCARRRQGCDGFLRAAGRVRLRCQPGQGTCQRDVLDGCQGPRFSLLLD